MASRKQKTYRAEQDTPSATTEEKLSGTEDEASDEEGWKSAEEEVTPADVQLALLEEQGKEVCETERTLQTIIDDLQRPQTIAGLQQLQEELRDKRQQLQAVIDRLSCENDPLDGAISDVKQTRENCRTPSSTWIQKLKQSVNNLTEVWDIVQCKRDQDSPITTLPPEYRLDDILEVDDKSSHVTQSQTNPVEVVIETPSSASSDPSSSSGGPAVEPVKVTVTPTSNVINLGSGPVRVSSIAHHHSIERAATSVLITKIDWEEELARYRELVREKQRLARQLEREKVKGQQQQEAREKAEKKFQDLYQKHQAQKQRHKQCVKSFYMAIMENNRQHLREIKNTLEQPDGLSDVIQNLYWNFDIRLLGVDSDLRILMDVSVEEYQEMMKQQEDIQNLLQQKLFPDQKVEWTQVTSLDLEVDAADLKLGQPVVDDAQLSRKTRETKGEENLRGVSFDPMTAVPRRVLVSGVTVDDDTDEPEITSIIATQDGRIVMADCKNRRVKVADVTNPDSISCVKLDCKPRGLALLQDGRVAVTSQSRILCLLDVSSHPSVVSRVQTTRRYWGVSAGTTHDTLIVSCKKDSDGPASVDVISLTGDSVRTVLDSNTCVGMTWPMYLCVVGGDVLVSDCKSDTVYRVELATGRVVDTLTHPDMKVPRQVCTDPSGNVYIACSDSQCVLVMSADGRWRRLLEGRQHGEGEYVRPWSVCVTGSRIVVSWQKSFYMYSPSKIYVYDMS